MRILLSLGNRKICKTIEVPVTNNGRLGRSRVARGLVALTGNQSPLMAGSISSG